MCFGKELNRISKEIFESLFYLIQSRNMIMFLFFSTNVILMQTVSEIVVDSFSIKYWLSFADEIVKSVKLPKKNCCSLKHSLNHY